MLGYTWWGSWSEFVFFQLKVMVLLCGKQNPLKVMIHCWTSEKHVLLRDFELALSLSNAFFFEEGFQILTLPMLVSFCYLGFVFGVCKRIGIPWDSSPWTTTIWEKIYFKTLFQASKKQIHVHYPALMGNSCPFPFVGGLFSGKILSFFFGGCPRSLLMWWKREVFQSYLKLSQKSIWILYTLTNNIYV